MNSGATRPPPYTRKMAWDDRFNNWYNRLLPNSGPWISWPEPVAGARWRWKANRLRTLSILLIMGAVLPAVIHTGKRGIQGPDWTSSLGFAAAFIGLIAAFSWIGSFYKTQIVLSTSTIVIGTGRSATRIRIDGVTSAKLVSMDGLRVLVINGKDKELARLFLDPEKEREILEFWKTTGVAIE